MELNLQPLATICCVTGQSFAEGDRVASHLVRSAESTEIVRYDVAESHPTWLFSYGQNEGGAVAATVRPRRPGVADVGAEDAASGGAITAAAGLDAACQQLTEDWHQGVDGEDLDHALALLDALQQGLAARGFSWRDVLKKAKQSPLQ